MVKRIGVGSGDVRGLVLAKVAFVTLDLAVIAPLPVIRPHPILTLCQGAIGKLTWYIAPLIIKPHGCNVPANIACDAQYYNYDPIVYLLFIDASSPPNEGL